MAHRTQLFLDTDQYDFLKKLASQQDKSMAQIIREWIDEKRRTRQSKKYSKDSLFKTRSLFSSGVDDMAENFDDYLYGDKN